MAFILKVFYVTQQHWITMIETFPITLSQTKVAVIGVDVVVETSIHCNKQTKKVSATDTNKHKPTTIIAGAKITNNARNSIESIHAKKKRIKKKKADVENIINFKYFNRIGGE
jgi:hypothetical protein